MHPELDFHFFQLAAYSFFTFAAFLVVVVGSFLFAKKRGFATNDALWMLVGMGIAAFFGARALNVIVNIDWYREDFSRVYAFDTKGFSLYGGIILAMAAGLAISSFRKIPLLRFADTTIPFVGFGIAIMRIGCFLNGCCFGKETDLPWGVTFPLLSPAHKHQISQNIFDSLTVHPVHPTQMYEFVAALFGSILVFIILRKQKNDGAAALIAASWFTAFRFINMHFRVLPYREGVIDYFYPFFYVCIIFGCVLWLLQINTITASQQPQPKTTL